MLDVFLILTFCLLLVLTVLVLLRRPPRPFWPTLPLTLLAALIWVVAESVLHYKTLSIEADRAWTYGLYTGVIWISPLCFLLALHFAASYGCTGRIRSPWLITVPLAASLGLWAMMLTQTWHGAFMEPIPGFGTRNDYRAGWYVHTAWSYMLLLCTFGIYMTLALRLPTPRGRRQARLLCLATLCPPAFNALYITDTMNSGYDPTIIGMGISALLIFVSIYRDHLFALNANAWHELLLNESDGIFLVDPHGEVVHANALAVDMSGKRNFTPGVNVFEVLQRCLRTDSEHPEPIERFVLQTRIEGAGRKGPGILFRLDHPERRWARVSRVTLRGWAGRQVGAAIRMRDVTALREATDRSLREAAVLQSIMENSERGVLVMDVNENSLYRNRAFERLWGFPDDMPPSDYARRYEHVLSCVQDRETFLEVVRGYTDDPFSSGEDELRLKDGRILRRTTTPLLDGDRVLGRIWNFDDITVQRHVEEERRASQHRLLETQRIESLGVLAGGIAHDFNNLLLGIVGYTELALDECGEAGREHLEAVRDAAGQAAELTNQILAYSGRGRLLLGVIDLSELARQTMRLMAGVLPPDIELRLSLDTGVQVRGDIAQLQQSIINIVNNARDAIPEGQGAITLRTYRVHRTAPGPVLSGSDVTIPAGAYAVIEVRDTGSGIDPAIMPQIFDPFFSTKFTGRGLGLAAVLGIARGHGGAVEVDSNAGGATTVRMLFPVAETAAPIDQRTVLVVDDEIRIRDIARATLESEDYNVLLAGDTVEALACARAYGEDLALCILDLSLPNSNPRDTVRELREASPGLPVVISSGMSPDLLRQHASDWGAQSALPKPYSSAALLRCLGEFCRKTAPI